MEFLETAKVRQTREEPPRVSVYDLIDAVTGTAKQSRNLFLSVCKLYPEFAVAVKDVKFSGRGQRATPVIAVSEAPELLRLVLATSRMPLKRKRELLGDSDYMPLKPYIEVEVHAKVIAALEDFKPVLQYAVTCGGRQYRIDLYFPEHRVAVECDENGHRRYDASGEAVRQAAITQHLSCTWVRYDPFLKTFDVFALIRTILQELLRA